MDKGKKAKMRSPKNEWMDNPYLLEAAVQAVEKGYSYLSWRSTFSRGWNRNLAWREYKCAAAWVRRENLKKQAEEFKTISRSTALGEIPAKYKNVPNNSPDTPAAISLANVLALREQEKAEGKEYIPKAPPSKSFEEGLEQAVKDLLAFAKGLPKQVLLLLAMIPFVVVFGGSYHSGLIVTLMPVLFAIGIAILIVRYIYALCISFFTGKPLRKVWHK
jgi:hypothetical protein